ncbi:hypothetical protein ACF0H5_024372 [Mactra antiquata]
MNGVIMAVPMNYVSPTDESPSRHHKKKRGKYPNLIDHRDTDNSIYSTGTSNVSPSIIGLQNLRESGSHAIDMHQQTKQPNKGNKWEGRKKTQVYVSVVFMKLGEIDTIKEFYEADIYVQARWREPLLDRTRTQVSDFKQFWNPELIIQNGMAEPKESKWNEIRYSRQGEAFIYEMRRVKGKFSETMELNDFPFDTQSISVIVSSELRGQSVEIMEDSEELCSINMDSFTDGQEWRLHNFVEVEKLATTGQYNQGRSHTGVKATCKVSRRSGYFSWNILSVVNLLSVFAFSTFAVKPELTPNRLQLSFILMLSAISLRFVANQSIPKVSYLTLLDKYLLTSLLFCAVITCWHAIISRFEYNKSLQNDMDFGAFIFMAVIFFCFQLTFVFLSILKKRRNSSDIAARELQYQTKSQKLYGTM